MSILIKIILFFVIIRTVSYGKWCLKYEKENIIGSVSVFFLSVCLVFSLILLCLKVK